MDTRAKAPLAAGTVLREAYEVTGYRGECEDGYVYDARAEARALWIAEYFPTGAVRSEGEVTFGDEKSFQAGKSRFIKRSAIYRKGIALLPRGELWEENGTVYLALPAEEEGMWEAPDTPEEARALGIRACEGLSALHRHGYGARITEASLVPGEETIKASCVEERPARREDVAALTDFLRRLAGEGPAWETYAEVLRPAYTSEKALCRALKKNRPEKRGKTPGLPGIIVCAVCLATCIGGILAVQRHYRPLAERNVEPEVISVWLPLQEGQSEEDARAMYERLAAGFERQSPGFGVNIRIFADGTYEEALANAGENAPVVRMDLPEPEEKANFADLSAMTASLGGVYIADMTGFGNVLPLGCSIPVLYGSQYRENLPESAEIASLPEGTQFDRSAEGYVREVLPEVTMGEEIPENFDTPWLASTSRLPEVEGSGLLAGDAKILPVTQDGKSPVMYEMYCAVDAGAPENSRHAGMLWLQYLLTEEAQQVLFVEHPGTLPIHEKALEAALARNEVLAPVKEVELDPAALQERR